MEFSRLVLNDRDWNADADGLSQKERMGPLDVPAARLNWRLATQKPCTAS